MAEQHSAQLFVVALLGIALLLFLIIGRKLNAFVALLLVSLALGLGAQWPHFDPAAVLDSMQRGMGGTLGFVAVVVGLGAMFGQLLEVSGGTRVLATGLLRLAGASRAEWALLSTGFLISIPVFFDVAFVILAPILYAASRQSGKPLLVVALPLLAGMVVTHSFVPPTPGPVGVAALLEADLGLVILFGLMAGGVSAVVAGPLFVRYLLPRLGPGTWGRAPHAHPRVEELQSNALSLQADGEQTPVASPGGPDLGLVLAVMALPLVLIMGGTGLLAAFPQPAPVLRLFVGLGHPFVALLLTTLLASWLLGTRRGLSKERLNELLTRALEPAGIIILITGAGGVLKQVLVDTGVGKALSIHLLEWGLGPLSLGFCVAWVVRVMQGSATVAMLTSAGLVVPTLGAEVTQVERALCVIAVAAGATCTSIVNDSGFWLVGRYLGLSVPETLRTWSVMTTVVGVVGFAVALLLHWLVGSL